MDILCQINGVSCIAGQRNIKELPVRCDNVERGCDSVVTTGTLDGHVTKCEYTLVPCPNGCNARDEDLQLMMRKDLDDHLQTKCPSRCYECKHCGEKGTYTSITDWHYKICKKYKIVPCPNPCCSLIAEHKEIIRHVETACMYTVVPCKYESIGCGIKMTRKDIKTHEKDQDEVHLHFALDKLTELNLLCPFSSLKKNISSYDEHLKTLKGHSMTFRLPGYGKMKERSEVFFSEAFYTSTGGYKMSIKVYPNGDGSDENVLSLYCTVLKGPYDDQLQWPFMGVVKFELLNQVTDDHHHAYEMHLDSECNTLVGDFWGYKKFIDHSKLVLDSASNTQYLMEDTLYFRVSVKVDRCKPWLDCTH